MDLATLLSAQSSTESRNPLQGTPSTGAAQGVLVSPLTAESVDFTAFDSLLQGLADIDGLTEFHIPSDAPQVGYTDGEIPAALTDIAALMEQVGQFLPPTQNVPTDGVQTDTPTELSAVSLSTAEIEALQQELGAEISAPALNTLEPSPPQINTVKIEALQQELGAEITSFLQDNPELADVVLNLAQENGVDLSALNLETTPLANAAIVTEAVQSAVLPFEVPLSSRLGILDTVLLQDTDVGETDSGETSDVNPLSVSGEQLESLGQVFEDFGLTPEQLSNLQDYLGALGIETDGVSADTLLNTLAELGASAQQALPPALQTALSGYNGSALITAPRAANVPVQGNEQQLAGQLNAIVTGGTDTEGTSNFEQLLKLMDGEASERPATTLPTNNNTDGNRMPATRGEANANSGNNSPAQNTANNGTLNALNSSTAIPAGVLPNDALLSASGSLASTDFADTMSAMLNGTSAPLSSVQSSLLAQAGSATQSHPASQMIAATLQKAGQNGQNTQITLQLEPADLGRVEVKMTIDASNAMHAVITAEKPETHLMMQRDSQLLERALQEAGIDSENSLSFELAEDGSSFFDDQERESNNGGHYGGGSGGREASDSGETIETTMNWSVNSATGHMHYSILA